jgi:uncharacterized protein YbjT (DUF2867 family)
MAVLLLAGATGLVGSEVLRLALADPRVTRVIAPSRTPLPSHPRMENPVTDFKHLTGGESWWRVDAVICALGTTIRKAGSQAAFREVDHDLPILVAKYAKAQGARSYAFTSSVGADARSGNFYLRTKGEAERDLEACGFPSLTIVRPSVIVGARQESRPMERISIALMQAARPLIPRRYRVVPATGIARTLLESALAGIPGRKIIESEEIPQPAG